MAIRHRQTVYPGTVTITNVDTEPDFLGVDWEYSIDAGSPQTVCATDTVEVNIDQSGSGLPTKRTTTNVQVCSDAPATGRTEFTLTKQETSRDIVLTVLAFGNDENLDPAQAQQIVTIPGEDTVTEDDFDLRCIGTFTDPTVPTAGQQTTVTVDTSLTNNSGFDRYVTIRAQVTGFQNDVEVFVADDSTVFNRVTIPGVAFPSSGDYEPEIDIVSMRAPAG